MHIINKREFDLSSLKQEDRYKDQRPLVPWFLKLAAAAGRQADKFTVFPWFCTTARKWPVDCDQKKIRRWFTSCLLPALSKNHPSFYDTDKKHQRESKLCSSLIWGKNDVEILDQSPTYLTSDYVVRSNEINRTKWPIY